MNQVKKEHWLVELVKTIVYAGAMVLTVHSLLFKPFHIPTGSMIPSLLIGDYLFVSKFTYGYSNYSFPLNPDLFEGRIFASTPKRGDVVVFRPPHDPGTDWIKRCVGVPGDKIQMIQGVLHVNGKKAKLDYVGKYSWRDDRGGSSVSEYYIEEIPGILPSHPMIKSVPFGDGRRDDTREFVVPEGFYFMVGDNRDNSNDSRSIGYIPYENIVGQAKLVFFSTDIPTFPEEKAWWKIWQWPFATRYSRILNLVK